MTSWPNFRRSAGTRDIIAALHRRFSNVENARVVGGAAGASAPEVLVDEVVQALMRIEPSEVSSLDGLIENVSFRLPAELYLPGGATAG